MAATEGWVLVCVNPACQAPFPSFKDLQAHYLSYFTQIAPRPHRCHQPGCGKTFARKADLRRHAKTHNPQSRTLHCPITGCPYAEAKAFYRRDKLLAHKRNVHRLQDNVPSRVMPFNDEPFSPKYINPYNPVLTGGNTGIDRPLFYPNPLTEIGPPGDINEPAETTVPDFPVSSVDPVSLPTVPVVYHILDSSGPSFPYGT